MYKWLLLPLAIIGCQKAPEVASSAQPNSVAAAAPMESDTSNAELVKRIALLERLLKGEIDKTEFAAAKALTPDTQAQAPEERRRLAKIIENLAFETLPTKSAPGKPDYEFAMGQAYFYERRFIEAAHIFSKLLDGNKGWLRARNLLARCFYFLGNTDRSFLELQQVLENLDGPLEEVLDALFLMGAIAMDSPTATPQQIEKGVGAWQTYLRLAPNSPLQQKIKDGLVSFEEKKKAKTVTKDTGDAKKDALAAVEGGDMLDAETKVHAAIKKLPRDDDLKVGLARVYVKTGRVKEALNEFAEVIKRNPRHTVAFHYQGMAFMMSGDPKGAIASWEKVLQLDKAYGDRFNLQGRIAIAQNLLKKGSS